VVRINIAFSESVRIAIKGNLNLKIC